MIFLVFDFDLVLGSLFFGLFFFSVSFWVVVLVLFSLIYLLIDFIFVFENFILILFFDVLLLIVVLLFLVIVFLFLLEVVLFILLKISIGICVGLDIFIIGGEVLKFLNLDNI